MILKTITDWLFDTGEEFKPAWENIVRNNVPAFSGLTNDEKAKLRQLVSRFIKKKNIEGCAGLEITDEIRVTIAAYACLLILHQNGPIYPDLDTVLVYPQSYFAEVKERDEIGVITEGYEERFGESSPLGVVVLAWDDIKLSAGDTRHKVVYHEFAHQLDIADYWKADGSVRLPGKARYAAWARVLGSEFRRLQRDADNDRETVLDKYGAEDPAEFFAVATEAFFTQPALLREKHPELYKELSLYYKQDPASRR